MTKYCGLGDTIHAKHTDSHARKIEWKGFRKNPDTQELMMLYECDRNSFSQIVKVCEDLDKECGEKLGYHSNESDCLEADAISIYVRSRRKLKILVSEGVTARHGAQFLYPRDYAISRIKTPLECLKKSLELKKELENQVKTIDR